MFKESLIARWISHLSQRDNRARRRFYALTNDDDDDDEQDHSNNNYLNAPIHTYASFLIRESSTSTDRLVITPGSVMDHLTSIGDSMNYMTEQFDQAYVPGVRFSPLPPSCSKRR